MAVPETQQPRDNSQLMYYICIVIGILGLIGVAALAGFYMGSASAKTIVEPVAQVQPIAAPAPTPTPTPVIPETVVFTVLSTSPSPHYTITTTTGVVYFCKDYYDWNTLEPQNTYSAIIDNGVLSNAVLLSEHYNVREFEHYSDYSRYNDYPYFYYYGGKYYQYDGHYVDEIGWKQARGQYIRYAKPPVSGYGAANPDIPYGSANPWQ